MLLGNFINKKFYFRFRRQRLKSMIDKILFSVQNLFVIREIQVESLLINNLTWTYFLVIIAILNVHDIIFNEKDNHFYIVANYKLTFLWPYKRFIKILLDNSQGTVKIFGGKNIISIYNFRKNVLIEKLKTLGMLFFLKVKRIKLNCIFCVLF